MSEPFLDIVEAAPEAIYVQTSGNFAYLNPAAVALFGASSPGELLGSPVTERIHPGCRETAIERIRLLNEERQAVPRVDQTYLRIDGSELEVEASAVPFRFREENGALVLVRDITGRKRMEEELRRSGERFHQLIDAAPGALFVQTRGEFAYLNHAALELFGATSAEQLIGTPVMDRFHAAHHSAIRERIRILNEQRLPVPHRNELFLKLDGTPVPVEVSAIPFEFNGEKGALFSARSISGTQEMSRSKWLAEERLRVLYEISQREFESERELIEFALNEAVRLTGSTIGFFHFLKDDQVNLELFTWSREVLLTCTAGADPHYALSSAGIWADSARTRKPVIHNDYQHEPERKGYPAGHSHIVRHMSVPVFEGDRVAVIAGVANKEAPYNDLDVIQLRLFMDGVWKMVSRRRTEAELRTSKAQLVEAQRIGRIGNWEYRFPEGRLSWSDEVFRIFQVSPASFEGTLDSFFNLVHPDDRDKVRTCFLASAENCSALAIDHRIVLPGGQVRWVNERGETFCAPDGIPLCTVGTIQDVTERVLADQALEQARDEWARTFDAVPDLIAILDRDCRIKRVNRSMAAALGMTPEAAVGKRCYEAIHKSAAPPSGCPYARLLQDGKEIADEVVEALGGHLMVSVTPLRDDQGEIIGAVHVAREINGRTANEQ
jgi:PAS domain S-box-containing protein